MKQNYPAASRLFTGIFSLLVLAGLAHPAAIQAQTYQVPATGVTTITTFSGKFYDDGGPSGPYAANASGSVTITLAAAGNKIRLQFTSVEVETGYDWVYIYDGSSISAPLIEYYNYDNELVTV